MLIFHSFYFQIFLDRVTVMVKVVGLRKIFVRNTVETDYLTMGIDEQK